ncbi:HAD-IIB family hydrolase [Wenyingzhuangia marina]|uniref:Glucosyl-3-phosphoglycerate phosphatase n=1 Tax=Wenyingzhuangia marina TaxID=1195760 RepID=A0A1M5SNH8_9FLAO|nr:HAD-IIB family hydrolase [Wenyingzhuangia marina]GGF63182.1 mannosyl-3-phosphoglycerate phosphatase [Wenyingzhuangia marina]SHH40034.1 glucosyl-3-phosphoglycerate phosphatase [Wenyingzhuangia marina]
MNTIIFTDLDGTFLNHNDYSFEASKEAREVIFKKEIPLVFTTSKTKIEVELLQKKVGIKEPFIVENGAALFVPKNYKGFDFSFLKENEDYYILQLGVSYDQIMLFYNAYKSEFEMFGFSDMTNEEVMEHTGLPLESAKRSKERGFTEPFLMKDEFKLEELNRLAKEYHLKITKGGRFYHLIGENQDKGKAVEKCVELFQKMYQEKMVAIGLGDGENDIPLLASVDIPIAIKNHEGSYVNLPTDKLQRSSYKGAKGWNEMILKNV